MKLTVSWTHILFSLYWSPFRTSETMTFRSSWSLTSNSNSRLLLLYTCPTLPPFLLLYRWDVPPPASPEPCQIGADLFAFGSHCSEEPSFLAPSFLLWVAIPLTTAQRPFFLLPAGPPLSYWLTASSLSLYYLCPASTRRSLITTRISFATVSQRKQWPSWSAVSSSGGSHPIIFLSLAEAREWAPLSSWPLLQPICYALSTGSEALQSDFSAWHFKCEGGWFTLHTTL